MIEECVNWRSVRRVICIALIILGIGVLIAGIVLNVQNVDAEVAAQIQQNGFYKEDVWIDSARYRATYWIVGVILSGLISVGVGIICLLVNAMD